jgi:hypothetical protein
MLIPESVFKSEFGGVRRQLGLGELIDIKARYGMSLAAIVQRALHLKLIGEDQYREFQRRRSVGGWRKDEPGRFVGRESSSRFEQLVLRAAAEEGELATEIGTLFCAGCDCMVSAEGLPELIRVAQISRTLELISLQSISAKQPPTRQTV